MVGGDIEIIGDAASADTEMPTLAAPGGRIALVSVGSPGDVVLSLTGPSPSPEVNGFERLGDLTIAGGALVSTGSDGGGTVAIRAEHLRVDGSRILADTLGDVDGAVIGIDIEARNLDVSNGVISSSTFGSGDGGDVIIRVRDTLTVTGERSDGSPSHISALADRGSSGSAGSVLIEAGVLTIAEGAEIRSSTFGEGAAGDVTIRVRDTLTVTGERSDGNTSAISASALRGSSGAAGSVLVEAGVLRIEDGAQIRSNTLGEGDAGNVIIRVRDTLTITGESLVRGNTSSIVATATSTSSGAAGSVLVEAGGLRIEGGGRISSSTFGEGDGGDVTIRVRNTLTITGEGSDGSLSRISALADEGALGSAGSVLIEAGVLTLEEGGRISSSTSGPGDGGDVTVNARQVRLTGGAQLQASSTGTGKAGDVTITVQDTLIIEESAVRTDAIQADGGNVNINANFIHLRDGQITTAVGGGDGSGGNIAVDARLGLLERSEIRADAFGGPGGNITIRTEGFISDLISQVSASSEQNVNGRVEIQGFTDLSGALSPLEQPFAAASSLLRSTCAERLEAGNLSSFIVRQHRLPIEPGGALPSPLLNAPQAKGQSGRSVERHVDVLGLAQHQLATD